MTMFPEEPLGVADLTPDQLKAAKATGVSPERYLAALHSGTGEANAEYVGGVQGLLRADPTYTELWRGASRAAPPTPEERAH